MKQRIYIDTSVIGGCEDVERVDVLVSWNFKHIVNINRIHLLNSVNLKLGYQILEIRSPREALYGS